MLCILHILGSDFQILTFETTNFNMVKKWLVENIKWNREQKQTMIEYLFGDESVKNDSRYQPANQLYWDDHYRPIFSANELYDRYLDQNILFSHYFGETKTPSFFIKCNKSQETSYSSKDILEEYNEIDVKNLGVTSQRFNKPMKMFPSLEQPKDCRYTISYSTGAPEKLFFVTRFNTTDVRQIQKYLLNSTQKQISGGRDHYLQKLRYRCKQVEIEMNKHFKNQYVLEEPKECEIRGAGVDIYEDILGCDYPNIYKIGKHNLETAYDFNKTEFNEIPIDGIISERFDINTY